MNNLQILRVLKGDDLARRYAVGVYPADRLPPVQKYPSALVVNSDPDGMRGSLWLAMYFDDHKKAEFFYSYGLPPEIYRNHFIQFLEKNSSHFVRNEVRLQSFNTTVCGQHCLFYLLHRCRNISMNKIVSVFTDDHLINNMLVHDFIEERYDVDVPVSDLDLICRQICVKKTII